ncbi:phage tail-collar fiber domain-containing protein [Pseudomonas sp. EL_65y_Pfl2_R96]|uniref:phage tail-collar fiber domain-containing protein n=1 Tax=Pseudomonas sp. EL_65y_Pfl2_R96 TaxID=3088699 RepID=UPI0030DBFF65
MVDTNTLFGGMLTTLGAAKKTNCDALGIPWEPKYLSIGDANGTDPVPSPTQTALIHQVHRAQLNQLRVSTASPR